MKRTLSFFRILIKALVGLGFTSCDEDIITGSSIQGVGSGKMYATSEWDGYTYTSSRTEIEFYGDDMNVTRGSGYWIDRYSRAPWDYFYSPFTYRVNRGVIYIHFLFDDGEVTISDYSVQGDRFLGYLNESGEKFVLYKVSDGVEWDDYTPGYDWNDYYYYNRAERDFNDQPGNPAPSPVRKFWNKQAYEGVEE